MYCATCGTAVDIGALACPSCSQNPLLDQRYRLIDVLGQGAYGTTWRAEEAHTGDVCAIKELPLRLGTESKTVTLFQREAQVLQQLHHPAIPTCHEVLDIGAGKRRALYIVMDFVRGHSLQHELRQHRYTEREVLQVLHDLLDVLVYLHGLSPAVVHRDIKPANVLRTPEGQLVLIDFGSVRDALRDADLGGSTVAGTFGFMAPEQFRGDAEPRTDLYGLGALAVALLTRKPPHLLADAQQRLLWREHANVSADMGLLLDALTAQDLVDRPESAHQVREVVRRMRLGEPSGLQPSAAPPIAAPSLHTPAAPAPVARGPQLSLQATSRQRLSAEQHRGLIGTIEQVLGSSSGAVQADDQGFIWAAPGPRSLRVEVRNEALGSRITVRESLGLTRVWLAAIIGGVTLLPSLLIAWPVLLFGGPLMAGLFLSTALLTAYLLLQRSYRAAVANRQRELTQLCGVLQAGLGGPRGKLIAPAVRPIAPVTWAAGGAVTSMVAIAWMSTLVTGEPLLRIAAVACAGVALIWSVTAAAHTGSRSIRPPEASLARRVTHGLFDGLTSIGSLAMVGLAIGTWFAWDSDWFGLFMYGLPLWQWLALTAAVVLPTWMITGAMARATAFKSSGRRKQLQEHPDVDDLERLDERYKEHAERHVKRHRRRRRRRDSDEPRRRR